MHKIFTTMTLDTTSPIYQNKPQRANSEDINNANEQQNLINSYALQRASSSDPKLPTQNNTRRDSISSSEESDSIYNATTPPRHLISNGSVSSSVVSTPTYLNEKTSRLQTIESGLSLADQQQAKSPKPPLHSPHRSSSNNSSTLLPPIPVEEDDDKRSNSILPQITLQRQTSHQSQQSTTSYYSVDAGKHNFLSYNSPNPNIGGDNDSINTHVSNGSLVFKYQVGEETPPADYALPASILKVYGDDVSPNTNDEERDKNVRGGVNHHNWHSGVSSTIVYKPSFDEDTTDGDEEIDEELGTRLQNAGDNTEQQGKKKSKNKPPRKSPPRLPHLPYHERKRLAELEEKDKQRRKSEAEEKEKRRKNNRKVSPKKTRIVKGASREYKVHTSEQTPLYDTKNGYGSSKTEDNEQQAKDANPSWFGQLVNIVTGNNSSDIDVEEEAKSYLNQGQAFLKKTEKERMKLKEQGRKEELAHVNIPVSNQSFGGHSRAITSMSQALDSIVSCSDEEQEDESSSDDEESGSYFQEQPNTPPKQVWKYGEPPTAKTQTKYTPTPKKKNTSSQRRKDSIMKRERLLQEEYEYRLRRLKNENEKLSRRFRIFVLVTVALIFCGALAFAFLVCIRMLMSL